MSLFICLIICLLINHKIKIHTELSGIHHCVGTNTKTNSLILYITINGSKNITYLSHAKAKWITLLQYATVSIVCNPL
jgi:hypothetical protein